MNLNVVGRGESPRGKHLGKGKWHVRVSVVFVDDEPLEDVGMGAGGGWSGVGGDLQGANPPETPAGCSPGAPVST